MSISVGKMRIGEVHALLRKDFPEIELSKIRYYEDKGLVQPSRSRKGYRLYSDRDVACLHEAIRLAQEEFVPLRVVRLRLVEQGLLREAASALTTRQVAREATVNAVSVAAPTSAVALEAAPPIVADRAARPSGAPVRASASATQYLTTQEFLQTTTLAASAVQQLIALGLLTPSAVAGETVFTDVDVRVAQSAGALLARGIDCRLLGSVRRIVEREVGVIEDLTEPLRTPGSPQSSDQAQRVAVAVASEVAALRSVLMERTWQSYLAQ